MKSFVKIKTQRNPDGSFLLGGVDARGYQVASNWLRVYLFIWHAPSAYGTFLDEVEGQLVLPADMALSYWESPATAKHLELEWDDEARMAMQDAGVVRQVLRQGWYKPLALHQADMDEAGVRCRWGLVEEPLRQWLEQEKVLARGSQTSSSGTNAASGLPSAVEILDGQRRLQLEGWLNGAIVRLIQEHKEAGAAWSQLVEQHPAAAELHPVGSGKRSAGRKARLLPIADEEEWRVEIGYRLNRLQLKAGLRLREPLEAGGAWRIQPVITGGSAYGVVCGVTPEGTPLPGEPLPEEWREAAPAVLAKALEAWNGLLPQWSWELDDERAWTFLEEDSAILAKQGYPVLLPRWWEELRKPTMVAKIRHPSASEGLLGLEQLVQFDWKVALGNLTLNEAEFLELLRQKRKLILWRGQWIPLHPGVVKRMRQLMSTTSSDGGGMRLSEVLELYVLQGRDLVLEEPEGQGSEVNDSLTDSQMLSLEVELNEHLQRWFDQLEDSRQRPLHPQPGELKAALRPYQLEGMSWLLFMRSSGFGACLADDMGLGKTLQFIAYLTHLKHWGQLNGPALLICPTSVLGNWQKELDRFAPGLTYTIHYGAGRLKEEAFREAVEGVDLVVTSYALALQDEADLSARAWSAIGLDEAQNIKNPHGKQSSAVRRLQGKHRIALTGTPVENRVSELWAIFDFINPGYLGGLSQFQKRFPDRTAGGDAADKLQRMVRPFLLRREKRDPKIQLNLPEKNEMNVYVSLTAEQAALYEQVLQELLEKLERLTAMERRGAILASLTKLKQICDHPDLYVKPERSAQREWTGRSNKLDRLVEMVEEVRLEGERCIIFTQYRDMGAILARVLKSQFGAPVDFLHGGVPKSERDRMVARFQDASRIGGDQREVLILSLKAGGTGLNLTAANHVFHFDRWWNPAVEDQASDRAYRIGQRRNVQVHKFVAIGTLEERIDDMIVRKQQLRNQIIGSGESWITELSTGELKELFALRRDWLQS